MAGGTEKKRRKLIWVHLRSGTVIKFKAREFNMTYRDGKLTKYDWEGIPARTLWFWRRRPMFIDPNEIAAVEVRGG